ncbi:MAG: NAD(+)/NADH kinase [Actinomycetota bacterium]|nr:NAD(+)/NADH kinase [Actinomycetota bacterium]
MRIGFVPHGGRRTAVEAAAKLVGWCRERGLGSRSVEDVGADEHVGESELPEGLDLVVAVGGDGTLLRAALMGWLADAPVLGVKVGRLGFLTEVEPEQAPELLEGWIEGRGVREERRMALLAEPEVGDRSEWALNEVIVEKGARHRVVRLATWVNDDYVTTFSADGVIAATPTGSTAYSFSARGPIVSPRLDCIVLTPVSAHMVFDRPIVLGADETVVIEVKEDEPGLLSADGRPGIELPVGSRVRIRRADRPARLLRRTDTESFYSKLRRKFQLPFDPTEVG